MATFLIQIGYFSKHGGRNLCRLKDYHLLKSNHGIELSQLLMSLAVYPYEPNEIFTFTCRCQLL